MTVTFSDGFESGDFSCGPWTVNGTTPTFQSTSHHGNYAMQCSTANSSATLSLNLNGPDDSFARFYLYRTTTPTANVNILALVNSDHGSAVTAYLDTSNVLWLNMPSGPQSSGATLNANTWYCIEVERRVGSGTGIAALWIDGIQRVISTTETISNYTKYVDIGLISGGSFTGLFDCFAFDRFYIGQDFGVNLETAAVSMDPTSILEYLWGFNFVTGDWLAVDRVFEDEQKLGTSYIHFKDTSTVNMDTSNIFMIRSGDPLFVLDRGVIVKKDLEVGGFVSSQQGVLSLGYGLHHILDPPSIWLLNGNQPRLPSGLQHFQTPPTPVDGQVYKNDSNNHIYHCYGGAWQDLGHEDIYVGNMDTLHIFQNTPPGDPPDPFRDAKLGFKTLAHLKCDIVNANNVYPNIELFDHYWNSDPNYKVFGASIGAPTRIFQGGFLETIYTENIKHLDGTAWSLSNWNGGTVSTDITIYKPSATLNLRSSTGGDPAITFYDANVLKMVLGYDQNNDRLYIWDSAGSKSIFQLDHNGNLGILGNLTSGGYVNPPSIRVGGTEIVSSSRVLSNVTANAGIITTGVFSPARLGTETPSASTYLRGDGKWSTTTWNGGTISNWVVLGGNVTINQTIGLSWHGTPSAGAETGYGIFRTSGAWTNPYQQLKIRWDTGIIIDANGQGIPYGVRIQPNGGNTICGGNLSVTGNFGTSGIASLDGLNLTDPTITDFTASRQLSHDPTYYTYNNSSGRAKMVYVSIVINGCGQNNYLSFELVLTYPTGWAIIGNAQNDYCTRANFFSFMVPDGWGYQLKEVSSNGGITIQSVFEQLL
jgi:hypothetical protein